MVAHSAAFDRKALKEKFLAFFPVRSSNPDALQEAVKGLVELGIARSALVRWALDAGYSEGYVRSILSRIFCALGLLERGVGAGRKPSPEALELLAIAKERYDDRFVNVLRAAWRAGKAQMDSEDQFPLGSDVSPSAAHPLDDPGVNCGSTIRQSGASGRRGSVHPGPQARNIFNGNSHTLIEAATNTRRKRP